MEIKALALLTLPICIITFLFHADAAIVGLHEGSTWARLVFHFFHGNILHLLINWWAFVSICFLYRVGWWQFIACFAIASLYPFADEHPIIGLSGIVYALLGSIILQINCRMYFLFNVALSFIVAYFLPNIAVGIHVWCFTLGILISFVNYATRD